MKSKGETIMEYATVLGLVIIALSVMQVYAKRGIQAGIKAVADEVGLQEAGAADYDYNYEWKLKGDAEVTAVVAGNKEIVRGKKGVVSYDTYEQRTQDGTLSYGIWVEEE